MSMQLGGGVPLESPGGTHKAWGLSLGTSLCFCVSGCGSKAFSIATVHPSEPDWRQGWTLVILAYCLLSTLQKYSYCPIAPCLCCRHHHAKEAHSRDASSALQGHVKWGVQGFNFPAEK